MRGRDGKAPRQTGEDCLARWRPYLGSMPLNLTKIAFGAKSYADLESWYANRRQPQVNTRYRPTRWEECIGGSLYWIHEHNIVARSTITGFTQQDNGRWFIELEPALIPVHPLPKRAHQGWRYLTDAKAPRDLAEGEEVGDIIPGKVATKLQRLGLI